jgi:hypothetical protein
MIVINRAFYSEVLCTEQVCRCDQAQFISGKVKGGGESFSGIFRGEFNPNVGDRRRSDNSSL